MADRGCVFCGETVTGSRTITVDGNPLPVCDPRCGASIPAQPMRPVRVELKTCGGCGARVGIIYRDGKGICCQPQYVQDIVRFGD